MIGHLSGTALTTDTIATSGGVGYTVTPLHPLTPGEQVSVWVHTQVRDNDIDLYAFPTPEHRAAFRALTRAPGIGGKAALAILTTHPLSALRAALTGKDAAALTRAPGIGAKTAAGILATVNPDHIPLPDGEDTSPAATGSHDAANALAALGFPPAAAAAALAAAIASGVDPGDEAALIRAALRTLTKETA